MAQYGIQCSTPKSGQGALWSQDRQGCSGYLSSPPPLEGGQLWREMRGPGSPGQHRRVNGQPGERVRQRNLLPGLFRLEAALPGGPTVILPSGCTALPSIPQPVGFFSDKQEAEGGAGSDQGHSPRPSAFTTFSCASRVSQMGSCQKAVCSGDMQTSLCVVAGDPGRWVLRMAPGRACGVQPPGIPRCVGSAAWLCADVRCVSLHS